MGHSRRLGSTAALFALLLTTSGCFSSLSVTGRGTASARGVRAGVRVDGDALTGLAGLFEAAAAADAAAADAAAASTTVAGDPGPAAPTGDDTTLEGGSVVATAGYEARADRGTTSTGWNGAGGSSGAPGYGEGRGGGNGSGRGGVAAGGDASSSRGDVAGGGGGAWISSGVAGTSGVAGSSGYGRGSVHGGTGGRAASEGGSRRSRVGRGHRLSDLAGAGIAVDGVRVSLGGIGALPGASLDGGGHSHGTGAGALDLRGALQASVDLEHAALPEAGGDTRLVVSLRGDPTLAPPRGRLRVHLVIDRSDSMEASWGQALEAARALVRSLSPADLLQIVSYGSGAVEVLGTAPVGDGAAALTALGELSVGGYTNIEAGLELAYGSVEQTTAHPGDSVIVILVSDGVPNVGAFGASAVGELAAQARRDLGCTTTVVGLGGEFDESVLRAVSRQGRGGYHVAATAAELEPALLAEVGSRERVAARDVRVRITVPRGIEVGEVQDGNAGAELRGRELTLALPVLHAAEERRVVVGLSVPGGAGSRSLATVRVRFRDEASRRVREGRSSLSVTLGGSRAGAAGAAALAALDADLATALSSAAGAVARNDSSTAAGLIDAHCAASELHVGLPGSTGLRERLDALERISAALEFYGPGASDGDRRVVARALGGLAISLGR